MVLAELVEAEPIASVTAERLDLADVILEHLRVVQGRLDPGLPRNLLLWRALRLRDHRGRRPTDGFKLSLRAGRR